MVGLNTAYTAVGGGPADGPTGKGSGGVTTRPTDTRRCGATGGASGTVGDVPGIVHGAEVADRRPPAEGKLVHVELAEQDRPGRAETAHDLGILRRYSILEQGARGGGTHAGCIQQILHRDRNAVQRTLPAAAGNLRLGAARRVQGGLGGNGDEGVERG